MKLRDFLRFPAWAMRPLLGAALCVSGMASHAADNAPAAAKPALTVTLAAVKQERVNPSVAANGTLAAWQEAVVGAEVSGLRIAQLQAQLGDRVKKGQVLATLADEMIRSEVMQAQAALTEAQAQAKEAQNQLERALSLQQNGFYSTAQVTQVQASEQSARARVQSAQAALSIQQLRLAQTQIRAPDAGIVSARTATVGSVVAAGTELFRLIRQGRIEWRAEVPAQELPRIRPGAAVRLNSASGAALTGRVRSLAPTVDARTRNALVYVDLDATSTQSATAALPGMFARGEIALEAVQALTVPQQSLVLRDGLQAVFVLQGADRVKLVPVKTGRVLGEQVEIQEGLSAQAQVVTQGAGFLNDGDTVRVQPQGKAAPAPVAKPAAKP